MNDLFMTIMLFFLISVINVILSTIKSLCTVRYGRGIVILMNVLAYGFYTIVVKQVSDLPLLITVLGTMAANAIGVWASYIILDKFQKDRLWLVQMTVKCDCQEGVEHYAEMVSNRLEKVAVPHNYSLAGKHIVFNCYCETQEQTTKVKDLGTTLNAKFSAFESKVL